MQGELERLREEAEAARRNKSELERLRAQAEVVHSSQAELERLRAEAGMTCKTLAELQRLRAEASDLPCNVRREGGQSLVTEGSSLVMLEGNACNPL